LRGRLFQSEAKTFWVEAEETRRTTKTDEEERRKTKKNEERRRATKKDEEQRRKTGAPELRAASNGYSTGGKA
jgi:hypothetical protein